MLFNQKLKNEKENVKSFLPDLNKAIYFWIIVLYIILLNHIHIILVCKKKDFYLQDFYIACETEYIFKVALLFPIY